MGFFGNAISYIEKLRELRSEYLTGYGLMRDFLLNAYFEQPDFGFTHRMRRIREKAFSENATGAEALGMDVRWMLYKLRHPVSHYRLQKRLGKY